MTDDNQEIIDRIEKAKAKQDKLPHVKLKVLRVFEEWLEVVIVDNVRIRNTITRDEMGVARKAWNARDPEINQLKEEIKKRNRLLKGSLSWDSFW